MTATCARPAAWLRTGVVVLSLMAHGAAARAASSEAVVSPKEPLRIGVASFEIVAAEGVRVPDVAALLADRLGASPAVDVVGPVGLSDVPERDARPAQVSAWAQDAGVSSLVTGRATRFGRRTSLDVRVRSGSSGETVATYVEEAPTDDALPPTLERLAERIRGGLEAESGAATANATAQEGASGPEAADTKDGRGGLLAVGESDEPLNINSRELEFFEEDGRRRILFTGDVRVVQGDLTVESQKLVALYPKGARQPERLVATGKVRIAQLERQMLCDEATYFNEDQRLVCVGSAELREGLDLVRGKEIEIDLANDRVKVRGGAFVNVVPDDEEAAP